MRTCAQACIRWSKYTTHNSPHKLPWHCGLQGKHQCHQIHQCNVQLSWSTHCSRGFHHRKMCLHPCAWTRWPSRGTCEEWTLYLQWCENWVQQLHIHLKNIKKYTIRVKLGQSLVKLTFTNFTFYFISRWNSSKYIFPHHNFLSLELEITRFSIVKNIC